MAQRHFTWDKFYADIGELAAEIKGSNCAPDMIVAVARGGWIPAYFLSDLLGIKNMASIGIKYTDKDRTAREIYSLPEPLKKDMRILLVEDILESGRSMEEAAHILESRGCAVQTASLYIAKSALYVPDFYIDKFDLTPVMPWEDLSKAA